LTSFPRNLEDSFVWKTSERGSGTTADFEISGFCIDKAGHIRFDIYMELGDNSQDFEKYNCSFYIDDIKASQIDCFISNLRSFIIGDVGTTIKISNNQ
jgi:hypothetical protein